ncbi:succinate-semialdehyde dehydrogenase/glutarate-semialdehyde dehydrogenase [Sphingomonas kaistensis]|uniref:Succinate-semialdehyde dehydrogenase/glutarate-semialdehyde dehydrogenase n=1 Tax=Sphingomonas kaistensis TaxID=298708 RepID=A0A7X6BH49_9SPHN|nr:NAD-dependent succinate-semialdehyde dehydrogenase [Sphingomonas kaistensis]NJC06578.1 succinate-semialdehyde dehydrogenase/glutarate-semialdehyde dehydrogenase [Sphingomonas kaistensis]
MADSDSASVAQVINPATGEQGKSYPLTSLNDALQSADRAHAVQREWRKASFADRAAVIGKVCELLRERADDFAALMTQEMGKTLTDGRAEVEKCAAHCDWFAKNAERYLADQPIIVDGAGEVFVTFNPLGVVLVVMPWNFPFWQVIRFAAPALMAGNGAVLKHASNVPGCALAIEQLLKDAGLPDGLFHTLLLPSKEIAKLIESPHIAAVTLTGSVAAGKSVAAAAGRVLKKCVLELGGSDAYLILDDADAVAAAKVAATARMVNGGQSCIAGKRFIVVEPLKQRFEEAMVEAMRGYAMGDPADEATRLGPMQSVGARDEVHEQVEKSIAKGARLLLGGEVPDRPGAWYPATVLTDVAEGQPAHDEEIFGPVAAIIAAKDEADAIRIANDSEFGLGSGVLTGDIDRGRRIARDLLDAGMSFVNENVRSDPRMPFGGVKHSGYGRECADYGIREFVNIKTVLVKPQASSGGSAVE